MQPLNHIQTRLIDGALRLLGVLQRHTDLIAQLGLLILPEVLFGLGKVVFEDVEKGRVVLLRDAGVVKDQGSVGDEGAGRFPTLGLDCLGVERVVEVDVEVDDREVHRQFLV